MNKENLKKKYEEIYEEVCEYLDNEFSKNICDFANDKCGEKINTVSCIGCCRSYKNKLLGPLAPFNNWTTCKYLKNKKCSIQNIGCKLFTCDYLNKKGIKFKIKDIQILEEFNLIQKIVIKSKVQIPKEDVIKKLLFWRNRNICLMIITLSIVFYLYGALIKVILN